MGKLGGAGLDVFEDESLPSESPLKGLQHVLLSPHAASLVGALFREEGDSFLTCLGNFSREIFPT